MNTNRFTKFIAFTMASALLLCACGIKGDLKTPPPLWGDKAKQEKPKPDSES